MDRLDRLERLRRQFERTMRIRQRTRQRNRIVPIGKVRQPPSKGYPADPTPPRQPRQPKKPKPPKQPRKVKSPRKQTFKVKKIKVKEIKQTKFPEEIINRYTYIPDETLKEIEKNVEVIDYRKDIKKHTNDLVSLAQKVCRDKISQGYIEGLFYNTYVRGKGNDYCGTMVYHKNDLIGFSTYLRKPKTEHYFVKLICTKKINFLKKFPLGSILMDLVKSDALKYEKKYKKRIRRIKLEAIRDQETIDFYKKYGFMESYNDPYSANLKMDYIIH